MTATACPAIQKLVKSAQEDMAEAIGHVTRGLKIVTALEGPMRGVNGLSEFLKAQDNAIKKLEEVMAQIGGE